MARPLLILPIENQVRELDAKLLLALLAAERGYDSIIGLKSEIDLSLGRFRPGYYFAKALTDRNAKVFRMLRRLGHTIIATDEEALVHYPPPIYYKRRVGLDALGLVDTVIAWGEANRRLLEGCPGFENHDKIVVLGNPRVDLIRPEISAYFDPQTEQLRREHGDFILVNTNFGSINCYNQEFNLFREKDGELVPGRGSIGMPRDFAEGLFRYRTHLFQAFQEIIPQLAADLPDTRIVLRPHPAEDHAGWRERLSGHPNVRVIAEGSVIPWLRASRCLIHNGCTTAIEAFVLGVPSIAFVPLDDDRFEFSLPNRFSRRAADLNALVETVRAIRDGAGTADPVVADLAADSICSLDAQLASERILDFLGRPPHELVTRFDVRFVARIEAEIRGFRKRLKRWKRTGGHTAVFARHRFPTLAASDLVDKLQRLSDILGKSDSLRVQALAEDIFKISATNNTRSGRPIHVRSVAPAMAEGLSS